MGIHVGDQISLGGFRDRPNEDRMGQSMGHAWVIDGATGLGEPFMGQSSSSLSSDAAWLAQRAHEAFTRHAAITDPRALLARAADDLVAAFEQERSRDLKEPWELPCGAFMLASLGEAGLTITWSGDCRALVQQGDGPVLSFGATPVSEEAEAALVVRLGRGGDPARRYARPEALAELRAGRGLALAPGNAFILAPDRGFLNHLGQATVATRQASLLMMTDGFAAAELRYGLFAGPEAMMHAARGGGLARMGDQLRRFEHETDPDGVLKPRWKRCDDATAIWLQINA
jgi:hypothetical protein